MSDTKAPVRKIVRSVKGGRIEIAVWKNQHTKGTQSFTTTSYSFQKSYTIDGKNWKNTQSFSRSDLKELFFMLLTELSKEVKEEKT